MPEYERRPNATVSNQWTLVGAATAHEVLDQAVSDPTAADVGVRVNSLTNGHVCEVAIADLALAARERVDSVTVKLYRDAPALSASAEARLFTGSTQLGSTYTWSAITAAGWIDAVTHTDGLTQSELDDLRIRLTKVNGSTAGIRVYAAYLRIATTIVPYRPAVLL